MKTRVSSTGTEQVGPRCKALGGQADGRTKEARRHKRLVDSIVSYLDHEPTPAETALAERAAALQARLDVFNAQIIRGEAVDTKEHCRVGNAMLNCLEALGVTPFQRRRRGYG